jgi:hypothetical protein
MRRLSRERAATGSDFKEVLMTRVVDGVTGRSQLERGWQI